MTQSEKALRAMLTEGISMKEAAERYGISVAAVCKRKLHPPVIQQLRTTVAEQQQRIAELEAKNDGFSELTGLMQSSLEGDRARIDELNEQLAAAQLDSRTLREALEKLSEKADELCRWDRRFDEVLDAAEAALSAPTDTSAFDRMIAEEREACAKIADDWNEGHVAASILARGEQ